MIKALEEHEQENSDAVLTKGQKLENEIASVLEDASKPLHYKKIHAELIGRGIRVPGEDPVRNVGAHLSRDKSRFVSLGKGIWALKEWQNEEQQKKSPQDTSDVNSPSSVKPPMRTSRDGVRQIEVFNVTCQNCMLTVRIEDVGEDGNYIISKCPACGHENKIPRRRARIQHGVNPITLRNREDVENRSPSPLDIGRERFIGQELPDFRTRNRLK